MYISSLAGVIMERKERIIQQPASSMERKEFGFPLW